MSQQANEKLAQLETRIEELLDLCETLQAENKSLKIRQSALVRDRAQLLEKTALARSRVEAMITRLKTMGQGT